MKRFRILFVLALGLVMASLATAQTQHFVISANAAGYGSAKGSQAVSLEGAAFQLTSNISVGYLRVSNPADKAQPTYNLGVANYTRGLDSLLGSKVTSKLVFDSSNWLVTFQGGLGKVSYAATQHIAEVGGVFLTRPVADHLSLTCGYQLLHGQGTSVITRNNASVPTVGLNFTF